MKKWANTDQPIMAEIAKKIETLKASDENFAELYKTNPRDAAEQVAAAVAKEQNLEYRHVVPPHIKGESFKAPEASRAAATPAALEVRQAFTDSMSTDAAKATAARQVLENRAPAEVVTTGNAEIKNTTSRLENLEQETNEPARLQGVQQELERANTILSSIESRIDKLGGQGVDAEALNDLKSATKELGAHRSEFGAGSRSELGPTLTTLKNIQFLLSRILKAEGGKKNNEPEGGQSEEAGGPPENYLG